jgi:hypothetical protein
MPSVCMPADCPHGVAIVRPRRHRLVHRCARHAVGVRAELEGFDTRATGLLMSAVHPVLLGSCAPTIIQRVTAVPCLRGASMSWSTVLVLPVGLCLTRFSDGRLRWRELVEPGGG